MLLFPFGIYKMNDRILGDTEKIMSNNASHQYLTTKAQQTLASSMLPNLLLVELCYSTLRIHFEKCVIRHFYHCQNLTYSELRCLQSFKDVIL